MKKEEAIVNLSTQYQKTMLIYLIPEWKGGDFIGRLRKVGAKWGIMRKLNVQVCSPFKVHRLRAISRLRHRSVYLPDENRWGLKILSGELELHLDRLKQKFAMNWKATPVICRHTRMSVASKEVRISSLG
jgi:hypothetical protein